MKQFIRCLLLAALVASLTSLPIKQPAVIKAVQASKPAKAPVVASAVVTPAVVAPIVAPVPVYTAGCAQYLPLIEQYDWSVNVASAIMQAESSCNPNAIGIVDYDGLRDYGLFQIHGEIIMQPAANVARAYQKYQSQGWHAWSTYNNGAYAKYLN